MRPLLCVLLLCLPVPAAAKTTVSVLVDGAGLDEAAAERIGVLFGDQGRVLLQPLDLVIDVWEGESIRLDPVDLGTELAAIRAEVLAGRLRAADRSLRRVERYLANVYVVVPRPELFEVRLLRAAVAVGQGAEDADWLMNLAAAIGTEAPPVDPTPYGRAVVEAYLVAVKDLMLDDPATIEVAIPRLPGGGDAVDARVQLDGFERGALPTTIDGVLPGSHRLTVTWPGGSRAWLLEVVAPPGRAVKVRPRVGLTEDESALENMLRRAFDAAGGPNAALSPGARAFLARWARDRGIDEIRFVRPHLVDVPQRVDSVEVGPRVGETQNSDPKPIAATGTPIVQPHYEHLEEYLDLAPGPPERLVALEAWYFDVPSQQAAWRPFFRGGTVQAELGRNRDLFRLSGRVGYMRALAAHHALFEIDGHLRLYKGLGVHLSVGLAQGTREYFYTPDWVDTRVYPVALGLRQRIGVNRPVVPTLQLDAVFLAPSAVGVQGGAGLSIRLGRVGEPRAGAWMETLLEARAGYTNRGMHAAGSIGLGVIL